LEAVEDDDAGASVWLVDTPELTPVELPEPDPDPSPVVVVVVSVTVVVLDELAGVSVWLVVSVEALALDDEDAGTSAAGMPDVTHLPLIGSQNVLEPSALVVSVAGSGSAPRSGKPSAGHASPVSICLPEFAPPTANAIAHE